jgi:LacI family transcriptional regulator, repressor for deo operon, udp, cdd, tsx, nupC, and nupG
MKSFCQTPFPRDRLSMRKRQTSPAKIADVARLAGVSVATVSRALANPSVVSAEARKRVLDAVRAIGYTPNAAARNLRVRRTGLVLVVVPDIANVFFAEILRGIDAMLSTHGYGLIIANLDNSPAKEPRYVDLVHAGQVDGILLLCGHVPGDADRNMASAGIPIVAACERIPEALFPQVEVNNRAAAREAVAHLVALGHRRIAYISGPKANILDHERRAGYVDALKEAGLQAESALDLAGDFTFRSGAHAASQVLGMCSGRPTAAFAANDEMAIGFLKAMHAAGIRIPQDMSVVGFDAVEYADFCEPTLTTVIQPRHEIGAQAALLLVQVMTGNVEMDARLWVRDSTASLSVDAWTIWEKARPPGGGAASTR